MHQSDIVLFDIPSYLFIYLIHSLKQVLHALLCKYKILKRMGNHNIIFISLPLTPSLSFPLRSCSK